MIKKTITCIECPKGCRITVCVDGSKISETSGYGCPRGRTYAENEIVCPRRVLTTTVRKSDGSVVPVKTDKPVKKSEIFDLMAKINKIIVDGKVSINDIIYRNITENINLIATDNK